MASVRTNPLPSPPEEYSSEDERTMRRTVEFALQNIETDVLLAKTQGDKDGSLAIRRFQFLTMGAS